MGIMSGIPSRSREMLKMTNVEMNIDETGDHVLGCREILP